MFSSRLQKDLFKGKKSLAKSYLKLGHTRFAVFVPLPSNWLVPPTTLIAHRSKKNVTFSKKRRGCLHANLVSTLRLTQCDPPFEKS